MNTFKNNSEITLSQYATAVKEIKNAIIDSRYRVARQANKEVLQLNYGIGRFISVNSRLAKWGSNAITVISKMLQQELPGLKGYSEASIKMMRIFYEEWCHIFENRQLPIDDFDNSIIGSESGNNIRIEQFDTDKLSQSDLFHFLNLDKYIKLPDENPSIGIILCKSKNEEIVELSFSDTSKPMGVATYRTSQELPEYFRKALPNIEELKKLL